MVKDTALLG